ncbi:28357_t:CDS:2, partial [Dentiscutata erythropus]
MADNLALLPDFTTNSHQDLLTDTHSNATIESLPKKSYATALMATSQQEVETAIAFLHTYFIFREVPPHIIDIPELPVPKWELFNNYISN